MLNPWPIIGALLLGLLIGGGTMWARGVRANAKDKAALELCTKDQVADAKSRETLQTRLEEAEKLNSERKVITVDRIKEFHEIPPPSTCEGGNVKMLEAAPTLARDWREGPHR